MPERVTQGVDYKHDLESKTFQRHPARIDFKREDKYFNFSAAQLIPFSPGVARVFRFSNLYGRRRFQF